MGWWNRDIEIKIGDLLRYRRRPTPSALWSWRLVRECPPHRPAEYHLCATAAASQSANQRSRLAEANGSRSTAAATMPRGFQHCASMSVLRSSWGTYRWHGRLIRAHCTSSMRKVATLGCSWPSAVSVARYSGGLHRSTRGSRATTCVDRRRLDIGRPS